MLHNTVARTLKDAEMLNNLQSFDQYPYLNAKNCTHSGYKNCTWNKDDAKLVKIMSVLILAIILIGGIIIVRVLI